MNLRSYPVVRLVISLLTISLSLAAESIQDMEQILERLVSEQREFADLVGLGAIFPKINAVVAVTSNDGNVKLADQCAWQIIKNLAPSLVALHSNNFLLTRKARN